MRNGDEPAVPREAMDAIYRRQRHIYDATRRFFLFGRDHLIRDLTPPMGGHVLEIACGTARNLIHAARRYPQATFYGFDVSQQMLTTARAAVDRAGLTGRITLASGDAADFDASQLLGRRAFDRVFVSYALSMMPQWRQSIVAALRVVEPGGRLHVVDFGQQQGWPAAFTRAHFAWLARFSVEPREDFEDAIRSAAAGLGGTVSYQRMYRGYTDYTVVTSAE